MMELMKFDCGGAAAVIGAARAIGHMRPEGVEAHFIVAACSVGRIFICAVKCFSPQNSSFTQRDVFVSWKRT